MPTLETTMRNILADAFDTQINTGAGTAQLIFQTAADAEVATLNLPNPAFSAASVGVLTLQGVPLSDATAAAGTMAKAKLYDRNAALQCTFTVGTSGQDINFSGGVVAALNDTVELTSLTVTVPA